MRANNLKVKLYYNDYNLENDYGDTASPTFGRNIDAQTDSGVNEEKDTKFDSTGFTAPTSRKKIDAAAQIVKMVRVCLVS